MNTTRGIATLIFIFGLIYTVMSTSLPVFFVTLGLSGLLGAWDRDNFRSSFGGWIACIWMFTIAVWFALGSYVFIFLAIALTCFLGAFYGSLARWFHRQFAPQFGFYVPPIVNPQVTRATRVTDPDLTRYQDGYQMVRSAVPDEASLVLQSDEDILADAEQHEQPQTHYPEQFMS